MRRERRLVGDGKIVHEVVEVHFGFLDAGDTIDRCRCGRAIDMFIYGKGERTHSQLKHVESQCIITCLACIGTRYP